MCTLRDAAQASIRWKTARKIVSTRTWGGFASSSAPFLKSSYWARCRERLVMCVMITHNYLILATTMANRTRTCNKLGARGLVEERIPQRSEQTLTLADSVYAS